MEADNKIVRSLIRFARDIREAVRRLPDGENKEKTKKLSELLLDRAHGAYGFRRSECLNCGDIVPEPVLLNGKCPWCAVTVTARIPTPKKAEGV